MMVYINISFPLVILAVSLFHMIRSAKPDESKPRKTGFITWLLMACCAAAAIWVAYDSHKKSDIYLKNLETCRDSLDVARLKLSAANRRMDELEGRFGGLKSKFDPVLRHARAVYPGESDENAIDCLVRKLGKDQRFFPRLDIAVKNKIVQDLKSLVGTDSGSISVTAKYEEGNPAREFLAMELAAILSLAGIDAGQPIPVVPDDSSHRNIYISFHPKDANLATELVAILGGFIRENFAGRMSETGNPGVFEIHIAGTPVFKADGSLAFD